MLEPVVHCDVHAHAFCVASQHTGFSLNVTSSKHISHGNCGVGLGLDAMSPYELMMIAAIYR